MGGDGVKTRQTWIVVKSADLFTLLQKKKASSTVAEKNKKTSEETNKNEPTGFSIQMAQAQFSI